MSRSRRELSADERKAIDETVPIIADRLVRLGRNYVAAVKAGPGEATHCENRFAVELKNLVVFAAESGAFD